MPEVLAGPIHENTAVSTYILRVPATEVSIEEGMRDSTQRLHRRLKAVAADIELDVPCLLCLMRLHGFNLP
jgi:tRNA G26 N,N-dimethylase Trm1